MNTDAVPLEVALSDVATPINERASPREAPDIPFIGLEHITSYSGQLIGTGTTADVSSSVARYSEGDLLYGRLRPYLNKVVVAPFDGAASAEFIVLRPMSENVSTEYLRLVLRSPMFLAFTSQLDRGDRPRVKWEQINRFRFELPSPSDQRAIVDTTAQMMERVKSASCEVKKSVDLSRLLLARFTANIFETASEEHWPEIPFGQLIAEMRNGLATKPANEPPGIPILRISSVRSFTVNLADVRYHTLLNGDAKYLLRNRDLLFVRFNGNAELVAGCGMVREITGDIVYPDKLIRVRVDESRVLPEYIELIFAGEKMRQDVSVFVRTAAGQHGISGGDLKRVSLPIPPIGTQRRIVKRFAVVRDGILRVLHQCDRAAALASKMEGAILARVVTVASI